MSQHPIDGDQVARVAIYPPVGVARVGNSHEYFLASERPGIAPTPEGGFKDAEGKVKKQAVRFRVYAFDKNNKVLGEIIDTDHSSI
ncbi:MAG TPA: hypothetical protein DCP28_15860, partial [Cytophagales bacterium]|nr:hypothetical protein [Cytophagales bacterium]